MAVLWVSRTLLDELITSLSSTAKLPDLKAWLLLEFNPWMIPLMAL
jgi:hypothetical protein